MAEPLLKEMRVRCSQSHAFVTFTEKIDLWWPPGHRHWGEGTIHLEARHGGRFFARTPTGEFPLGEVVECSPHDRIRYTWLPGGGTGPTEVEVRFVEDGEHTHVHVEHTIGDSGLGELWDTRVNGFSAAWDEVLRGLANYTHGEE